MSKGSVSMKYLVGVCTVMLFLVTIATLPKLDFSEPNVFFYLQHLTPLYYLCLVFSLIIAVSFGKDLLGILAAIIFSLLLLWTPSLMLVQSWPMDTYPFLSQAVYVARNGNTGTGTLSETPSLGLFFGSFLSLTGIDPFILVRMYPAFFTVIFVVLLYLIAKQIGIEKKPVIAPLLSVAVMWPNEVHFSRQCFSLIFYVGAWFFLLKLMKKKDRRIFLLLLFQILLLTLSHPGSSLFFITNLVAIVVFGSIFRKFQSKDYRLLTNSIIFSVTSWIVWNAFTLSESKGINVLIQMFERVTSSMLENPSEVPGLAKIFVGYTSTYSNVIHIRLVMTGFVCLSAIFLSVVIYHYDKNKKTVAVIMSWLATNIFSAVFFLYAGLPFMARPALFSFIAWAPLGALTYKVLNRKRKKVMTFFFISAFVIVPAFLMPIIKYAPIPFAFATGQELASATFIYRYWNGSDFVYLEASPPYTYSYIVYGMQNTSHPLTFGAWYIPGEGLDQNVVDEYPTLVTYRIITRDAFWEHTPSMYNIVVNLTLQEESRNKVYDSGWPYYVSMPLPISQDR